MALRMALAGCGGMGLRHVHGIAETANTFGSLELVAVCDIHHAAAAHVAREVKDLFGQEPVVYTDFREMLDDGAGIDVLDITHRHPNAPRVCGGRARRGNPRLRRKAYGPDDQGLHAHGGRRRPLRQDARDCRELPPRSDEPARQGADRWGSNRCPVLSGRYGNRRRGRPDARYGLACAQAPRGERDSRTRRAQLRSCPLLHGRRGNRVRGDGRLSVGETPGHSTRKHEAVLRSPRRRRVRRHGQGSHRRRGHRVRRAQICLRRVGSDVDEHRLARSFDRHVHRARE